MQCHRSRIDKKLTKHTASALCILVRKHKPDITVAASIHLPLLVFSNNNWTAESFHWFKINELWKLRDIAFIRNYETLQSSNATRAIFWSKTSHIIAPTCNWLRGWNTSRVLIWQANIHGRFTWTSFADLANPTIKAKHIHRWQLANSFCSSAPLTVYPVSTKPNKNKYSIRCAFTGGVS